MAETSEEKKYIGFNADPDVMRFIQKQNDVVYATTGRSNQTVAINMLIRAGAEAYGWKK